LLEFVLLEYIAEGWNCHNTGRVREKCSLPGLVNNVAEGYGN